MTDFRKTATRKKQKLNIDWFNCISFFKGQIGEKASETLPLNKDEKKFLSLMTPHQTFVTGQENLLVYYHRSQLVIYDWITRNKKVFSYQGSDISIKGNKLINSNDQKTRIVNMLNNEVILEINQSFDKRIIQDDFLIGCHYEGLIEIWDLKNASQQPKKTIQRTALGHHPALYHVFLKNSNIIIVRKLEIKILNFEGEEIKSYPLQCPVKSAYLYQDCLFLTYSETGIIEARDINTLTILFTLDPKSDHGNSWNPNPCIVENFLAQANTHLGEVKIWDMATQQCLNTLKLSTSYQNLTYTYIKAMQFNPHAGILKVIDPNEDIIYTFKFKADKKVKTSVKQIDQSAKKCILQ